jgi:hypothetical protein
MMIDNLDDLAIPLSNVSSSSTNLKYILLDCKRWIGDVTLHGQQKLSRIFNSNTQSNEFSIGKKIRLKECRYQRMIDELPQELKPIDDRIQKGLQSYVYLPATDISIIQSNEKTGTQSSHLDFESLVGYEIPPEYVPLVCLFALEDQVAIAIEGKKILIPRGTLLILKGNVPHNGLSGNDCMGARLHWVYPTRDHPSTNQSLGFIEDIIYQQRKLLVASQSANDDLEISDELKQHATGLTNVGTSCYFNCMIQLLRHIDLFIIMMRETIEKEKKLPSKSAKTRQATSVPRLFLLSMINQLITKLEDSSSTATAISYSGRDLTNWMRKIIPKKLIPKSMKGCQMEMMEVMAFLFQKIAEEFNQAAGAPPDLDAPEISSLFHLKIFKKRTCNTCKCIYQKSDIEFPLKVALSSNGNVLKLIDLLEMHYEKEEVDCCCGLSNIEAFIDKLPKFLLIQLKRFTFSNKTEKLHALVEYEKTLDFQQFCQSEKRLIQSEYTLTGIIYHHGNSLDEGHYTCVMKISEKKWCYYDDDTTHIVDDPFDQNSETLIVDDSSRKRKRGSPKKVISPLLPDYRTAYVLLYRLKELHAG